MLRHYSLDENHNLIPLGNLDDPVAFLEWAKWFEVESNRRVAEDWYNEVQVSTIFLGFEHGTTIDGEPLLFETMIFNGEWHGYQARYTNWNEAIEGHEKALTRVKKTEDNLWPDELEAKVTLDEGQPKAT